MFRFVLLCCFFVSSIMFLQPQDINIKWGIYTYDELKDVTYILDISEDLKMKTVSYIRVFFDISQDTYLYFFLLDANKDFYMLYPDSFDVYKTKLSNRNFYIPSDNDWFYFENNDGESEEFYLIASNKRLIELENFVLIYLKEKDKKNIDKNKENLSKRNILNEIIRLKRINSNKVVIAEKPISTAGVTKGINSKNNQNKGSIIEVTSNGFYAKTIKLGF